MCSCALGTISIRAKPTFARLRYALGTSVNSNALEGKFVAHAWDHKRSEERLENRSGVSRNIDLDSVSLSSRPRVESEFLSKGVAKSLNFRFCGVMRIENSSPTFMRFHRPIVHEPDSETERCKKFRDVLRDYLAPVSVEQLIPGNEFLVDVCPKAIFLIPLARRLEKCGFRSDGATNPFSETTV